MYTTGVNILTPTIELFEEETGIKVIMDEFDTNEEMYPKIQAGAINYDVVCPQII